MNLLPLPLTQTPPPIAFEPTEVPFVVAVLSLIVPPFIVNVAPTLTNTPPPLAFGAVDCTVFLLMVPLCMVNVPPAVTYTAPPSVAELPVSVQPVMVTIPPDFQWLRPYSRCSLQSCSLKALPFRCSEQNAAAACPCGSPTAFERQPA